MELARFPGIWEFPQIPTEIRGWYIFKVLEISQIARHFRIVLYLKNKLPLEPLRNLGIPKNL